MRIIETINFDQDNFAQRRASQNGAGVAYDPDSLITGAEIAAGLDYDNSTRVPVEDGTFGAEIDAEFHARAVTGDLDTSLVLAFLPRTLKPGHVLTTATTQADNATHNDSGRWNWYEGE